MKNYTIRFFSDYWDYHEWNGGRYYLLILEEELTGEKISKFVKAETPHELTLIKKLIRQDRLILINYLLYNDNKHINNLVAEITGLVNEFFSQFKQTFEKFKNKLQN